MWREKSALRGVVRSTKLTVSQSPGLIRVKCLPRPCPHWLVTLAGTNGHTMIPFAAWSRHGSLATEAHSDGCPQHLQSPTSSQQTQNPDPRGFRFILLSLVSQAMLRYQPRPVPREWALAPHLDLAEGSLAHSCQPSSAGESSRDRLLGGGCTSEQEPWPGAPCSDQSYPLSTSSLQLLLRAPV